MASASTPVAPRWVDDPSALAQLVQTLRSQPRFAIDTESNSLHAHTARICLVQISAAGTDYIVDPLAVDLAPLGAALADPKVEKVMHGADYDVMCFKRGHGLSIDNLFDTMLAERVLGRSRYGLGSLLEEHFGFRANKKMQRFDWGLRPLPDHAVDYARYDTHFLLELRDKQHARLAAADRLQDHAHACQRQARVVPRVLAFDPTAFWRIKGVRKLAAPGPAVLHQLFVLRERLAAAADRPPFRIANDATLLELARALPADRQALGHALDKARGIHPRVRRDQAGALLDAIARGVNGGPPPPPTGEPTPPRDVVDRFDGLRAWRKSVAEARGVEPDIVIDKGTLMQIAVAAPTDAQQLLDCGALDDWEYERYGAAILAWLAKPATR